MSPVLILYLSPHTHPLQFPSAVKCPIQNMIHAQESKLVFRYDDNILWVEAWVDNSLRVRATKLSTMPERDWALTESVLRNKDACTIETYSNGSGSISSVKIQASVSK